MPVAWCLADPKLGEREVAAELLGYARDLGALGDGMVVLAVGRQGLGITDLVVAHAALAADGPST